MGAKDTGRICNGDGTSYNFWGQIAPNGEIVVGVIFRKDGDGTSPGIWGAILCRGANCATERVGDGIERQLMSPK